MSTIIIDMDYLKYTAAAVGEKRTIKVVHKKSGREMDFKNRTEFKGVGKKLGGWLAKRNEEMVAKGKEPFQLDDFEIIDIQTPEPLQNVLHTCRLMHEGVLNKLGTRKYKGFVGSGDSFRVERSTILKYKGPREDLIKPIHMRDVEHYIIKNLKAEIVTEEEADDRCVMECFKTDNILAGVDKDYYGCPVYFYNINRGDKEGIVDCNNFGKLWRDDKGDIRGHGRIFFYWQVLYGDKVDNYFANSATDVKWGEISAFNALVNTTNDVEALQAVVDAYKTILYPEPRTITGWRGNDIEVDWRYVLNENWDMARMLRFKGDNVTADNVLEKLDVKT